LTIKSRLVAVSKLMPASAVQAAFDAGQCPQERFIDNLLVRIHFIIVMIVWTGLVPWQFEFPFAGSLTSTFLCPQDLGSAAW